MLWWLFNISISCLFLWVKRWKQFIKEKEKKIVSAGSGVEIEEKACIEQWRIGSLIFILGHGFAQGWESCEFPTLDPFVLIQALTITKRYFRAYLSPKFRHFNNCRAHVHIPLKQGWWTLLSQQSIFFLMLLKY